MSRRRDRGQLELPGTTSGAAPQPRGRKPEGRDFHAAVLALRRAGHRVYRGGSRSSVIDGERRANRVVALWRGDVR